METNGDNRWWSWRRIETLYTSALGLVAPWVLAKVGLGTTKRSVEFCVRQARSLGDMSEVHAVSIDETRLRRGQRHITLAHDLAAKRLLFATEGRSHHTVLDFAQDLKAHGGQPAAVRKVLTGLMWGMCKKPSAWSGGQQSRAMRWLQRSTLKFAGAWRLKMALREVYAVALSQNDPRQAERDLRCWLSWAKSAAPGLRTAANFIAIAYLRMSRLSHLPDHPFIPASAK